MRQVSSCYLFHYRSYKQSLPQKPLFSVSLKVNKTQMQLVMLLRILCPVYPVVENLRKTMETKSIYVK